MKVTIKGQVTIPQAMRERYDLRPGTEVEFVSGKNALEIRPVHTKDSRSTQFDRWLNAAAGSARHGITTDAHLAITRGED